MEELSELGHRDLFAGPVTLEGEKTVILSLYLDITREVIAEHLVKAIEYCKKRRFAIFLGIDSNVHSDIWGQSNKKRLQPSRLHYTRRTRATQRSQRIHILM